VVWSRGTINLGRCLLTVDVENGEVLAFDEDAFVPDPDGWTRTEPKQDDVMVVEFVLGTLKPPNNNVEGCARRCATTAANVNDTLVFERLFLAAFAVMARIRTVFADKATMPSTIAISAGSSAPNPASTSGASHTDQGWASGAGRSSAAMPCRISASLCGTIASASSSSHCFRPHASSWLRDAWPTNCENRL
jgi:hypothetical protein